MKTELEIGKTYKIKFAKEIDLFMAINECPEEGDDIHYNKGDEIEAEIADIEDGKVTIYFNAEGDELDTFIEGIPTDILIPISVKVTTWKNV